MKVPANEVAVAAGLDFHELPTSGATIQPIPAVLSSLLGSRVDAITLGRRVVVSPDRIEDLVAGGAAELLAHELVHVRQWKSLGTVRFIRDYVTDYVRLRMLGLDHHTAYRHIGLEWAAYDEARRIVRAL